MKLKTLLPILLAVPLLMAQSPVSSSRDDRCEDGVEALAQEGAEHFQNEEFNEAAEVLEEAYYCEPIDILLYNIARSYQQAGRCVPASEYFQSYLETGDTAARAQAMDFEASEADCADRFNAAMSRADAARERGEPEAALEQLQTALEISDELVAKIIYGETLIDVGRCEEAIDVFLELLDGSLSATQRDIVSRDVVRAETICYGSSNCDEQMEACRAREESALSEQQESVEKQRLIGMGITGAGAVLLLTAMIHDVASQSLLDDYETAAARGDEDQYFEIRDSITSRRTASIALYGTGTIVTVVGAVVWISSYRKLSGEGEGCENVCWDLDFQGPTGGNGLWVGGRF